jgi:AcrR family transcriptional regulator
MVFFSKPAAEMPQEEGDFEMKQKILDLSAQLIQKYGLRKFTVDEIASGLKISKKTIYKYFNSKDDIIRAYFEASIQSDKDSISNGINSSETFLEKIHCIVYSNHQYRLSIPLLNEAKLYYPDVWEAVQELKQFKLNLMKSLTEQASKDGILKENVHFGVLFMMIEEISDMCIDYDFLIENKLNIREAIDNALQIIFNGILQEGAK